MNPFVLPTELPTELSALTDLRGEAAAWFDHLKGLSESGTFTDENLGQLKQVVADMSVLGAAITTAEGLSPSGDTARDLTRLIAEGTELSSAAPATVPAEAAAAEAAPGTPAPGTELSTTAPATTPAAGTTPGGGVLAEPEPLEGEVIVAAPRSLTASGVPARRTRYAGLHSGTNTMRVNRTGQEHAEVGWRMAAGAPGYKDGLVDFSDLARSLDTVQKGHRPRVNTRMLEGRAASRSETDFNSVSFAGLQRFAQEVNDPRELVETVLRATDQANLPGGSLTAAGGWCAPSETLYDFCAVPTATDLISLPEITINRGGVRWPNEPDLTSIFEDFEWFYSETELEATDDDGNPTAIKSCVEIPCPPDFTELRLSAVGYCVEAGILQTQGWPELIDWFMQELTQEHFRSMSRRTINDMVSGSGSAIVIPADTQIGVAPSILNSMSMMATNLRLDKGLARNATIEFVAPSWFFEVIRADFAMQQGVAAKAIDDATITSWLSARNLTGQFVGDWQTRGSGQPGNMATTAWPATMQVIMYPAGTWFRALSNVITLGLQYPRELLQINRYTRMFIEDSIVVGKRCFKSVLVTIPICPTGAFGSMQYVACNTPA